MKVLELNSQIGFFKNYEEDFLKDEEEGAVITVLDNTEVLYSEEIPCDKEYCIKNNISFDTGKINNSGTFVGVKGSIVLTLKKHNNVSNENLSMLFSNALCEYLKNRGLNSTRCDNNDVLVDNFKVASGIYTQIGCWRYMGYQISINQDIDLIKTVCLKPMIKIPKALSDYGITTEEIVSFCKDFVKQ